MKFRPLTLDRWPDFEQLFGERGAYGGCWCMSREAFPRIERSRTLKRLDERPTWSVNCLFIAKPYRGNRLMLELLKAAVEYAQSQGAAIIEGYPREPRGSRLGTMEGYPGIASVFREAGFRKVRRRVQGKVISRYQFAR